MKKFLYKPGFEFVFSVSIMVMIALPPLVFGQAQQMDLQITINQGDTIVNGKNIKDLSPKEKKDALKDINELAMGLHDQRMWHSDGNRVVLRDRRFNVGDSMAFINRHRTYKPDSLNGRFRFRGDHVKITDTTFSVSDNTPDSYGRMPKPGNFRFRTFSFNERAGLRNTQNFDFTTTGSDGITTRINFRVSDVMPAELKKVAGIEKNSLDINDLSIAPQFSAGKVILICNLPVKSMAELTFTNNDGKVLWTEKNATGEVLKSFPLGLNGVYFLEVKQAGKVAVKRIVKE
jgi:hypothetical protein